MTMLQQTAKLNYLHIAPRKVRLIANTIRGLTVSEAEAQLLLRPQRSAKPLLKLLRSAIANAKNNQKLNLNELVISAIRVDEGPMLKRFLPRAMGRATPIHKKMSHVTLVLEERLSSKPSRFTIIPPIKKKKDEKKPKIKKEGGTLKPEGKRERPKERSSFLKRIFQRKSI